MTDEHLLRSDLDKLYETYNTHWNYIWKTIKKDTNEQINIFDDNLIINIKCSLSQKENIQNTTVRLNKKRCVISAENKIFKISYIENCKMLSLKELHLEIFPYYDTNGLIVIFNKYIYTNNVCKTLGKMVDPADLLSNRLLLSMENFYDREFNPISVYSRHIKNRLFFFGNNRYYPEKLEDYHMVYDILPKEISLEINWTNTSIYINKYLNKCLHQI